VALLDLQNPPSICPASYRDYLPWLKYACFDRTCAYCIHHLRDLQVDHVEPVSLAPSRKNDPSNLLPTCATCNGPGGKWDYHPKKLTRRKASKDCHGFLALDPRVDDYGKLYEVGASGVLDVKPGDSYERALWNRDVLFRLNRRNLVRWRSQTLKLAEVAEVLVSEVMQGSEANLQSIQNCNTLVHEVAQRLLFFELFDLPLSAALQSQALKMRDELRGALPPCSNRGSTVRGSS